MQIFRAHFLWRAKDDHAIYHIGKFGACPAAIRTVLPGAHVHDGSFDFPKLAYQSFPNLGATIAVGVVCGADKMKMGDVFVSTQFINYDHGRAEDWVFIPIEDKQSMHLHTLSVYLENVDRWPNHSIKSRLNSSNMSIPKIKPGVIFEQALPY